MIKPAVHGLGPMAVAASSSQAELFLLAAFELENRLPLLSPLDAPAIAAGTGDVLEH